MVMYGNFAGYGGNEYMLFGTQKDLVFSQHQYYRIITYMFDHGGIMHLLMNMVALYSLGMLVPYLTSEKFSVIIYFIAGIGSGIVTSFQSTAVTVGASGAIYGLFGVLIYIGLKEYRLGNKSILKSFGPTIIINIIISFTPGISLMGHLSGLVIGLVGGYIFDKRINKKHWL
jgi:rhomboid protease GluP